MSWLKKLLGLGGAIEQFDESGAVVDTSNAHKLVTKWNVLDARYEKLSENWTPVVAEELVDLKRKMRLIEHGSVMRHMSATQSLDITSPHRLTGDIRDGVHRCDDVAIAALEVRIVRQAGSDYRDLAQAVIDKHPNMSDRDRQEVGLLLWRAISAFYELAVVKELGVKDNIYIQINIRNTMSGIQTTWLERQGIEISREEVHARSTEFVEFGGVRHAIEGDPEPLGKLIDAMLMGSPSSADIGRTIAQLFSTFSSQNRGKLVGILAGHL